MTDDELDRLQALADKVTTGPWGTIPPGGPNGPFWGICNRLGMIVAMRLTDREADAAFIAASRDVIPALIAEVRRLSEALGRILLACEAFKCPREAADYARRVAKQAVGDWE